MLKRFALVLLMAVPACQVSMMHRDETTIAHVDRTIEARERDFDTIRQLVERGLVFVQKGSPKLASDIKHALSNLEALQKSELSRLKSFRDYENDKAKEAPK